MNKPRRKAIQNLYDQLSDIKEQLEEIYNEEEEYKDSIPENLQGSERYEKAEMAVENLAEAAGSLYDILENLEAAME